MIANQVRQMPESFPVLFCVTDHQRRLVYVSKNAAYTLGFQREELIGKTLDELIAPEQRNRTLKAISDEQLADNTTAIVTQFSHKNGSLVPVAWYLTINAENGWLYGLGQTVMYATPEHTLSGNYIGKTLAQPEGRITIDKDFRITDVNEAAANILGTAADHLRNTSLWDAMPDAKGSIFETEFKKAFEEATPVRFESLMPSIGLQWLEVNAFPIGSELLVFFRNITSEKKDADEMRTLSTVAKQTGNLVLLTDATGNITWVNNAFTQVTGYSPAEAFAQPLVSMLSGLETDTATTLYLKEAIAKGEPFHTEILQYNKGGDKLWLEVVGQPIRNADGRVEQFFSIQTDISKKKEFEEQLHREQQQRQQKITRATIEAQERERSLVSQELHDNVNQVLTTVKLYNELCLTGIEQQEELLNRSVQFLQQSISEIRALSKRLSAPTLGKFRLRDSVKELTDNIEATNQLHIETDISLLNELEVPQDLHLAIYRILQEHFTNILKHASAKYVLVSFETVNDELVIKVRDDGKGFNVHELSGGIGIANMLTRAESMKGTLTLNSAPGLGCVLMVRFPFPVDAVAQTH